MKSRSVLIFLALSIFFAASACKTKPAPLPEPTTEVTESAPAPEVPKAPPEAQAATTEAAAEPSAPSAPTETPAAEPALAGTVPLAAVGGTRTQTVPELPGAPPAQTIPQTQTDTSAESVPTVEVPMPSTAPGTPVPAPEAPKTPSQAPASTPAPDAETARPQSADARPVVERSAFQAESGGFWPAPASRYKTIRFSLLFGNRDLVKSWRIEISRTDGKGGPVRIISGQAPRLPESVEWDGATDDGSIAAEGRYGAKLFIDYGDALPAASLSSKSFVVSIAAPRPNLRTDPQRLDPDPKGIRTPMSIEIGAQESLARIESWSLRIIGPDGTIFRGYSGSWPAPSLRWDGLSSSGAVAEPGARYTVVLDIVNEYGQSGTAQLSVLVSELPFPLVKSSVKPWTSGFSPNGDNVMDAMDLSLSFGHPTAVSSWTLEISGAAGLARRWTGTGASLPETVSWDGSTSAGKRAMEGSYVADLSVDYGKAYSADSARSPSFILDTTPPKVTLSISPEYFSPDGDGFADTLDMVLDASTELGKIVDWSIDVFVVDGGAFHRFSGSWPAAPIVWDGRDAAGNVVESAEEYPVVATVRDEFGNAGSTMGIAGVDILLIKDGDGYRINVASIVFKGFTADYEDIPPDRAEQNIRTLNRLAAKLSKFPEHKIRLVGHAVMIYWDDPDRGFIEQEEVLLPLSKARAEAIAAALAERGIQKARMSTDGVGASDQVVPDSDYANRWKNRRVVFFLERR